MRLDKLLYFLRLAKSRTAAQLWTETGYIRVNGRRIERAHSAVRVSDVITLPHGDAVLAIRIIRLPIRRGPAQEAQGCYQILVAD
jgi:ribosome-associated heat shock protein Hsp15